MPEILAKITESVPFKKFYLIQSVTSLFLKKFWHQLDETGEYHGTWNHILAGKSVSKIEVLLLKFS